MDALIMNVNEPPSLLRNDAPAGNHWIKIRLEGVKSNRSAIGARVLARYGGKVQAQEVLSQSSYLSASDPRLHFRPRRCRQPPTLRSIGPLDSSRSTRTCRRSTRHHSRRNRNRKGTPRVPTFNSSGGVFKGSGSSSVPR
jgi:hypothetical protein